MKELLTGKCKEDFEKWLNGKKDVAQDWYVTWAKFDLLTFSCQYGVYLEFFDSVGIYISIEPLYDMQGTNRLCIYSLMLESNYYLQCKNRKEAQQQAIIKANSIYNERH